MSENSEHAVTRPLAGTRTDTRLMRTDTRLSRTDTRLMRTGTRLLSRTDTRLMRTGTRLSRAGARLSVAPLIAACLIAPAFARETLKVVERPVGETTVDLAAKGDSVGDLLVFANGIFDAANKTQIGTDQGYCVRTIVGKSWECIWTITLEAGQITVEGPFRDEGDSLLAVTGGTGKYAGAKGSLKLHPRDATPTGYDFTYALL